MIMAETIKEMAVNSAKRINESTFGSYTRGYKDGAIAILTEIEKCLENPSMIQGYSDVLAKVQELKGE